MSLFLSLLLATASAQAAAKPPKDVPIPEKLPPPRNDKEAPTVSIRNGNNGDVIEEYRTGGRITMVHIIPKGGGKGYYLYDDNGDGRLDRTDADKNATVSPVYFTIYEWN